MKRITIILLSLCSMLSYGQIGTIGNEELGGSVRTKLNSIINAVNTFSGYNPDSTGIELSSSQLIIKNADLSLPFITLFNQREALRTRAQIVFQDSLDAGSSYTPAFTHDQLGIVKGVNYVWGKRNLDSLTSGSNNIAIGWRTLEGLKTGSYNTFIGHNTNAVYADVSYKAIIGNTAVGYGALSYIGYTGGTDVNNTAVGLNANAAAYGITHSTAIGANTISGSSGIAIGSLAKAMGRGVSIGYNIHNQNTTTGDYNVLIGYGVAYGGALSNGFDGSYNVAVGDQAFALGYTKADSNTVVGAKAAYSIVKGSRNTSIGFAAMVCNVAGAKDLYDNISIGYNTMNECDSAKRNTIIGNWAGTEVSKGSDNVALGYAALLNSWTGNKSTAIGAYAMNLIEWNHIGNTAIGYGAGRYTKSDSSIYIGMNAGASDSTHHSQSGQLFIDNQDRDSLNTFIYGDIRSGLLRLNTNTVTKTIEATDTVNCIVIQSSDGSHWRLRISNTGVITSVKL